MWVPAPTGDTSFDVVSGVDLSAGVAIKVTSAQPTPTTTTKPNDTGITDKGYDARGNLVACALAAPGNDCNTGRDADSATNSAADGRAGFSFTKLDANGNPLAASATTWSCVKDNITGLIWELKTADDVLRDVNKTYTNYLNASQSSKFGSATDATGFVNAVNAQGLCGAKDWRLPTRRELVGIVDYSVDFPGPTIDKVGFGSNTAKSLYWSSSPYAGNSASAWFVFFSYGYVSLSNDRSDIFAVRLVRAGQ